MARVRVASAPSPTRRARTSAAVSALGWKRPAEQDTAAGRGARYGGRAAIRALRGQRRKKRRARRRAGTGAAWFAAGNRTRRGRYDTDRHDPTALRRGAAAVVAWHAARRASRRLQRRALRPQ